MADIVVRAGETRDEAAWRTLWQGYLTFYEAEVAEDVTKRTWTRMLTGEEGVVGRVAEHDGQIVGFSVAVVHAGTWSIAPACYLEDLFVAQAVRGRGVGAALIDDLVDLARQRGWATVYWHTRASNAAARRLYDKYVAADDFVRYRLKVS